jgi:putative FmdB family regulatory protein
MPIYEYRCADCGFQNEYLQRMRDAPLTDCPECGKPSFRKMVTAAGFQLKGSGWYATDFKNNGAKPAKSPEKSAEGAKKEESKSAEGAKNEESKSAEGAKNEESKSAEGAKKESKPDTSASRGTGATLAAS